MSLVSLNDVLPPAMVQISGAQGSGAQDSGAQDSGAQISGAKGYGVVGAVVLGWEDAQCYVEAAEELGVPVILQAGPKFRQSLPLDVSGAMFCNLAQGASVPVVAHIDHARSIEECQAGIDAGFSSLMYDGSALPLEENIANTAEIVRLAHRHNVSVEAEIGFVGYAEGVRSEMTDPSDASRLASETGIDALAVSVGNTHLQQSTLAQIDLSRLAQIEAGVNCPLVLHGASGIPLEMRRHLALNTAVCKFNIGTEFRVKFGETLRQVLADDAKIFDRGEILRATQPELKRLAVEVMAALKP